MNQINQTSALYAAINSGLLVYNKLLSEVHSKQLANQTLNSSKYYQTVPDFNFNVKANSDPGFRPNQWDDKNLAYAVTNVGGYFFDAVLKADHSSTTKITEHPIQNGASISDHAYMLQDRLVLEIGMSDCMDSFVNGQFSNSNSKSVSAYQVLKNIQSTFQVLTIVTRLTSYKNMLIESINAPDDVKTKDGLKATVNFKQIFLADVNTNFISARPQITTKSGTTSKQPLPVDNSSTLARKLEDLGLKAK